MPKSFRPFDKALAFARELKLGSHKEWKAFCRRSNFWTDGGLGFKKRPANVLSNPNVVHKHDGWQGWGHWTGTDSERSKSNTAGEARRAAAGRPAFMPFEEAREAALALRLGGSREWVTWSKSVARPASNPHTTCKRDGWQGWGH